MVQEIGSRHRRGARRGYSEERRVNAAKTVFVSPALLQTRRRACKADRKHKSSRHEASRRRYLAFFARDKPSVQLLLHSLTRERFKEVHGLNPADFEFAAYLGVALGKTLAEIVEVPVKTWMLLEVALLVFWRLDAVANANARLGGWIMFGYCLPVIACVTHGKLRRILLEHAGPLLRSAEERGGNVGLLQQTKCLAPRRQASQKRLSGASARRRSTTSPRRPSETSSQAASDTTATGATPPRNKPSPRKSRKQVSFPTFPSHQSSPERGAPPPPPPPPHSSESPSSPMSPRRRLPRFPSPLAWFRKKRRRARAGTRRLQDAVPFFACSIKPSS